MYQLSSKTSRKIADCFESEDNFIELYRLNVNKKSKLK